MSSQGPAPGAEDSKQANCIDGTPERGTNSHEEKTTTTVEMSMRSQEDGAVEKCANEIVDNGEKFLVDDSREATDSMEEEEEQKSKAENSAGKESVNSSGATTMTSSSETTEVSRSGDPPCGNDEDEATSKDLAEKETMDGDFQSSATKEETPNEKADGTENDHHSEPVETGKNEMKEAIDAPAEGPVHSSPVVATTVTEEDDDDDDSGKCEEKKDVTPSEKIEDSSANAFLSSEQDAANDEPMDASGRLSEELLRELPKNETPKVQQETLPEIKETMDEDSKPELEQLQTIDSQVSPHALPTPVAATTKIESDAAIKLANQVLEYAQLPPELLANKDKEGFGLLARGDSFRKEQELQRHQQETPQPQHSIDNIDAHPRIPQEPDAVHRREDSSVANDVPREHFSDSHLQHLDVIDDNSHRPLDDNSYRPSYPPSQMSYPPSQVSYPPSPQGLPPAPPQTIALNNGAYMVMPQHQGQPPHAFIAPPPAMLHHQSSFHSHQAQMMGQAPYGYALPNMAPMPSPSIPGGKRKIKLKLQEEILARPAHNRRKTFFFGARSTRKLLTQQPLLENEPQTNEVDRGTITVSWYEGTSTMELQEHVNGSVARKLKLEKGQTLDDIRILDTKVNPPEEVVLSPYIPSGSEFVLRYKIKLASGRNSPTFYGPPDSPSAAPSPFPSRGNLGALDDAQLAVLRKQLDAVQDGESRTTSKKYRSRAKRSELSPLKSMQPVAADAKESKNALDSDGSDGDNESESNTLQPESSVDAKLRQITELLLVDKQRAQQQRYPQVQKRQVIFVLANYFVLFVAFITVSAEIQARAPDWLSWVESQLENVQTCSADQEALYKCISNGEFAGLFATVILWLTRSATTKRFFLFGFDTPQKLWTVFYESLVGAFCWGVSYMFIRRGMNPDTRPQFLQRYWKDAVYGSLAGFNATFMKQVLKNLIPQEAVEEAFNDRQLKILSWLPTFG